MLTNVRPYKYYQQVRLQTPCAQQRTKTAVVICFCMFLRCHRWTSVVWAGVLSSVRTLCRKCWLPFERAVRYRKVAVGQQWRDVGNVESKLRRLTVSFCRLLSLRWRITVFLRCLFATQLLSCIMLVQSLLGCVGCCQKPHPVATVLWPIPWRSSSMGMRFPPEIN